MPSYPPENLAPYVATLEERVRKLEIKLALFAAEGKSIPIGGGFTWVEGAGSRLGTATLAGGAAVVSSTVVTASSRILVTSQDSGVTGALRAAPRVAGLSFTINSNNAADAGVVAWFIVEPT